MEKLSDDLFKKLKKDELSMVKGGAGSAYEATYRIVWSNDIEHPPCGGTDKRYDTAATQ